MGFRGSIPWTPYTPTFSSSGAAAAMNVANRRGRYRVDGSVHVHLRCSWTNLGSGEGLGTGNYRISLPVPAASTAYAVFDAVGSGWYLDASARGYLLVPIIDTTTTVLLQAEGGSVCGAAFPAVPQNGDYYSLDLEYEPA